MSPGTYSWLHAVHIVGAVLWVIGLTSTLKLIDARAKVDAGSRDALTQSARATAIVMDVGMTLAIVLGFILAFKSPLFAGYGNAFKSGGWLHVKLTLVALALVGGHGWTRFAMRKIRKGGNPTVPAWLMPTILLAVIAVVILAANGTLLRK
jgi:uncharacterized membrane protein